MPQYDETNRWTLFKNDRKETDKHPDYTGSLDVNGAKFWVSGWIQTSKDGRKFFSGSIKAKESLREAPMPERGRSTITSGRATEVRPLIDDDDLDGVPF